MAQRKSGYEWQPDEFYPSPAWVIDALGEVVALRGLTVWEPAAGAGDMADALRANGATVWESDSASRERREGFEPGIDFLTARFPPSVDAIISNPPFGTGGRLAVAFAERGLALMRAPGGPRLLALLLAADFDSASGRTHLFADCPEFAVKLVLLRRIRWFDGPSGPSTNHAWFAWQRCDFATTLVRGAVLRYAPRRSDESLSLESL